MTQEAYHRVGRITTRIESGQLFDEIKKAPLDPTIDRVMVCGSTGMLQNMSDMIEARGFMEGSNASPADYALEKAFVSQYKEYSRYRC